MVDMPSHKAFVIFLFSSFEVMILSRAIQYFKKDDSLSKSAWASPIQYIAVVMIFSISVLGFLNAK